MEVPEIRAVHKVFERIYDPEKSHYNLMVSDYFTWDG